MTYPGPTSEPINLRWRQNLAASWSIFWPAWTAYLLAAWVFLAWVPLDSWIRNSGILYWVGGLAVVIGQGLLTFRLVRKNYRSFWIGVLQESESPNRRLGLHQQVQVWFQLSWL